MENLKIDTSEKEFLMKNKNSEFGMQSFLEWFIPER